MQILVALLIFTFIVFIHELGHFTFAKLGGIGVVEFAIGMGPKLISKKFGDTIYSIRILPIGGYCKMVGEDESSEESNALNNKSAGVRFMTLFGGAFFNFILAFIFSMVVIGLSGQLILTVNETVPDSPAAIAGLQSGDKITHVNGEYMINYYDYNFTMSQIQGEEVTLSILRDGKKQMIKVTPKYDDTSKKYYVGFYPSELNRTPLNVISNGFTSMIFWVKMTYKSLFLMITGQVSSKDVAGPVGLVTMIGDGYKESVKVSLAAVISTMAFYIVLISANLGVVNLLPIPALDGMRLVFVIIEVLRKGKKIDPNKEGFVHFIGFVFLMLLMVLILFNDITRLVGK